MPDLIIVIPFTADANCDLDQYAMEIQQFFNQITNHNLGENIGTEIDHIRIVHKPTDFSCNNGDFVILFAHGSREATALYNNQGEMITMDKAIAKLISIHAHKAKRLLFMCCYSGLDGHIGSVWKGNNSAQETLGGNTDISNLYTSTRTQIRSVCGALFELQ